MQVYIVECGNYEDKHIVGVFSTREEAEKCRPALGCRIWDLDDEDVTITSWTLDPVLPFHAFPRWKILLFEDGSIDTCKQTPEVLNCADLTHPLPEIASSDYGYRVKVMCFAKDEAAALRIAREELGRKIARRTRLRND